MLVAKKSRQLVLNLKNPERVLDVVTTARKVRYKGHDLVAVPHRPDETKILRNLGFDTPDPIQSYYTWPGRFVPFKHQKHTAEFLNANRRAYCLNGMGTAKTLSVLWAYDYLKKQGVLNKMIVTAPLSTLERTWGDEIFGHLMHLNFAVLHGTREKRRRLLDDRSIDIYIINHDGLKTITDMLAHRPDIDLVVVDEIGQAARNSSTDRWKQLNLIVNKQCPRWCWGLTGTPTPNEPTDAWAQCRLITPETVPPYYGRFRDTVMRQISQFKWAAREGALDTVYEAMRPAIRYAREDCIDLPPTMYEIRSVELTPEQKHLYKEMMNKLKAEYHGGSILAVNEAVKMNKLIQVCCLAYNTDVLTDAGWVPIQDVSDKHFVWDGVEWVPQLGCVFNGVRDVVEVDGVRMTEDHKVWVGEWKTAKDIIHDDASDKFTRVAVRLPDSSCPRRSAEKQNEDRAVGVPMRLRGGRCAPESVPPKSLSDVPEKLRMSSWQRSTQNGKVAPLPDMGEHASQMLGRARQRLEQLRSAWDLCVRSVERIVRRVLGRCWFDLRKKVDAGPYRQQRPLFAGELPMGLYENPMQQQAYKHADRHPEGGYDGDTGCGSLRYKTGNSICPVGEVQVAGVESADRVYDLINCGPRSQFVVRGNAGELLIVHNCGLAYGDDGKDIDIPVGPRMDVVKEIIDEAEGKVIVFVPLTGALNKVAKELDAHLSQGKKSFGAVEIVDGSVSKGKRDQVFQDFQKSQYPRVIVAHAASMSHGLTLTEANTIIWYAPLCSADIYEQANARIVRPGQTRSTLIVHIEGSEVERRIYNRLKNKSKVQNVLLDMFKEDK